MNNSDKLSLFPKNTSGSVGLTDVSAKTTSVFARKLSLNKQTIANLNNIGNAAMVAINDNSGQQACKSMNCPSVDCITEGKCDMPTIGDSEKWYCICGTGRAY